MLESIFYQDARISLKSPWCNLRGFQLQWWLLQQSQQLQLQWLTLFHQEEKDLYCRARHFLDPHIYDTVPKCLFRKTAARSSHSDLNYCEPGISCSFWCFYPEHFVSQMNLLICIQTSSQQITIGFSHSNMKHLGGVYL